MTSQRKHMSCCQQLASFSDILKIIKNLDPNKAHGHDMIRVLMEKHFDASICKPLELIFRSRLKSGRFPLERKKINVVPTHKKGDKANTEKLTSHIFTSNCQKNV